jgi:hypothetical protein
MDATSKQVLDAFGEAVIREVYDRSCKYLFDVISRGMKGNEPDPLHLAYQSLDPATAKLLRQFLFEAVDQTFAQFLAFIDNHNVAIPFLTTGGDTVRTNTPRAQLRSSSRQTFARAVAASERGDWGMHWDSAAAH